MVKDILKVIALLALEAALLIKDKVLPKKRGGRYVV